jgi:hypothetical protein
VKVGDLVFDSSVGLSGIIVQKLLWLPTEIEHVILYEDGVLDTAYEDGLEVVND